MQEPLEPVVSEERPVIVEQAPAVWRRPQLERLRLSLDTSNEIGSFTDALGSTIAPP